MAFKAQYVQRGENIDYVPEANVAAGDVVFIGKLCGIAKLDIEAGKLGALAVTGVYDFVKGTGAITAGTPLYWDGSKAVSTPGTKYIGVAIADAKSDDTVVRAIINAGKNDATDDESSSGE